MFRQSEEQLASLLTKYGSSFVALRDRVFHGVVWSDLEMCFFRLKSLNCFPVKTHVFGKPFVFCTFCLKSWGFEFAPARGSPASVIDHVMISQDYIKVEQVRTWLLNSSLAKFLILVLQSSNSLNLNAFFNFASIYFFLLTWSMFSFCLWGLVFLLFCSPCQDGNFWFFCLKSSNGY